MTHISRLLPAAILMLHLLAEPVLAQVFPSRGDTQITDDAELLSPEVEAQLTERLSALKAETGADLAVVTLISTALYTGGEEIDTYAGLLFDAFGLAAAPESKAVMLLVFRDDRELRIETGTAYDAAVGDVASGIITDLIVPAFADGNFEAGLQAGVDGIITQIISPAPEAAAPTPAAEAATPPNGGGGGLWWLLGLFAVPVGGIIWAGRRRAAKLAATPCPSCGKTGLREESVTVIAASTQAEGKGERRTICPHCGHTTAEPYAIARLEKTKDAPAAGVRAPATDKSSGEKKSGGGATGKW